MRSCLHVNGVELNYFTIVCSAAADAWSQFLWYKNPGGDDAMEAGPWEIGAIMSEDECDTGLRLVTLTADGRDYDAIYTSGYFSNTFNVYWTEDPNGLWTDTSMVSIKRKYMFNFEL